MNHPTEIGPDELRDALSAEVPPRLLDVRQPFEWDIVRLDGAQLVTETLIEEMMDAWPRDTPIVCYCHHGIRSLNAAVALRQHGFSNVRSLRGGIDLWARSIDPGLARY